MPDNPSQLARMATRLAILPSPIRHRLLTLGFTRAVRFAGTAGIRITALDKEHACVEIPNRRRIQNHIRGVHAAATALVAETASGAVFGYNLPADRLPLLKSLHVDYLQRAHGGLRATATLDDSARQQLETETSGSIRVPVTIMDDNGEAPVACEMVWAWVTKDRRESSKK